MQSQCKYSKIVHSIISEIDDGVDCLTALRAHLDNVKDIELFFHWCEANNIMAIMNIYLGEIAGSTGEAPALSHKQNDTGSIPVPATKVKRLK